MGLNTYPCSPFPPSTVDMEKGDVTEQQKALIETIPGKAQKADIAPEFSTETVYNAGDLVYYNGALYEFTADHAAGAWSTDDTQEATIDGSLDQLKSGLTNLDNEVNGDATTYPYADVITINDAVPANLAECNVKIEPVQDLHGFDHPWVGGAGDNKLDTSTVTVGGVTFTEDTDGYVSCADGDGRSWSYANCQYKLTLPSGSYKFVVDTKTVGSTGKGCVFKDSSDNDVLSINSANLFAEVGVVAYDFTLSAETSFGAEIKHGGAVARFMIVSSTVANTWQPYENICPITGHTEASVQRDGKNLFDVSTYPFTSGYYINALENGDYVGDGADFKCTASFVPCSAYKGMTLTLNKRPGGWRPGIAFYSDDSEANFISGVNNNNVDAGTPMTFTVPSNANYMRFTVPVDADNIQIELGSTATAYEPYNSATATITFGQTVYGGSVDFKTGKVRVDKAYQLLNDPNKWISTSGNIVYKYNEEFSDRKQYTLDSYTGVFTSFISIDESSQYTGRWQASDSNYFGIRDDNSLITLEQLKTMASAGDLQICYELATPTTIQLTPQQIQLLKGTNTLTASTGQISVTVNGVSGAIGQVLEQVNETDAALAEIAEQLPTAPTTDGAYVLTVTVASGTPTYSWESAI